MLQQLIFEGYSQLRAKATLYNNKRYQSLPELLCLLEFKLKESKNIPLGLRFTRHAGLRGPCQRNCRYEFVTAFHNFDRDHDKNLQPETISIEHSTHNDHN